MEMERVFIIRDLYRLIIPLSHSFYNIVAMRYVFFTQWFDINQSAVEVRAWMSNYNPLVTKDVITNSCSNLTTGLAHVC